MCSVLGEEDIQRYEDTTRLLNIRFDGLRAAVQT
jgi:hypothetical protein